MKKNQAIRMKRNLSLFLVLIMLTTPLCQLKVNASQEVAIPQNMETVSAGDASVSNKSFDVEMQIDSRWDGGYNATVIINNTGDTVIDNWHLKFFSEDIIQNIWNASVFSHEEGIYTIKNAQHNQDIAAGEFVSFGFTATCEDEVLRPEGYVMPVEKSLVKEASYACEYSVNNDMTESFYNATFSICNLTEESIEDWIVEFDFAGTIDTIWNGEIIGNEGNHYIIKNAVYNQNIMGNSMVSFGFNGKKQEGHSPEPGNIRLYQINYNSTQSEDDDINGNVSDGDVSSGDVFSEDVDTDGDGIMDAVEARLGFDVYSPDTDKDGLPDGYELYTLYPILLKSGYDESAGINAEDDYDRDGLTNLEECQAETNPGNEDTDGDSIKDYEELRNLGTNPILFDTDNDGLNDGLELDQGMNPLNTDSDEDGIPDGEEILSQQLVFGETKEKILEEAGVIPILSITGKGDYSQKIEIVDISHNVKYKNTGFVVGHPYDFRHDED